MAAASSRHIEPLLPTATTTAGQIEARTAGVFGFKPTSIKAAGAFASKPIKVKIAGSFVDA